MRSVRRYHDDVARIRTGFQLGRNGLRWEPVGTAKRNIGVYGGFLNPER
ncbi:MAG: hypothetical protein AAFQ77_02365 [Myxococcota bacterium]